MPYTRVRDLEMYYELHGDGDPLLLLHGQFATIGMFSRILPELARDRLVIAVEQQGHGHTADVDRPLRFATLCDDTAALLRHIGIVRTDVYGYSTGGCIALHLAVRHPRLVRKLAVSSAVFDVDGYLPEIQRNDPGLTPEDLRAVESRALVLAAERDVVRPEHSRELARLLRTELVILPDSDHTSYVAADPEPLLERLREFFGIQPRNAITSAASTSGTSSAAK